MGAQQNIESFPKLDQFSQLRQVAEGIIKITSENRSLKEMGKQHQDREKELEARISQLAARCIELEQLESDMVKLTSVLGDMSIEMQNMRDELAATRGLVTSTCIATFVILGICGSSAVFKLANFAGRSVSSMAGTANGLICATNTSLEWVATRPALEKAFAVIGRGI